MSIASKTRWMDIISMILIYIEVKCLNCTGLEPLEIEDIAKIFLGWKSQKNKTYLKYIVKWILVPRFSLDILVCLAELIILWNDNATIFCTFPSGVIVAIVLFAIVTLYIFIGMCVAKCTSFFDNDNIYIAFLLFFRVMDMSLNITVIALEIVYDFKSFAWENIAANALFLYSCYVILLCFYLSLKPLYFFYKRCNQN